MSHAGRQDQKILDGSGEANSDDQPNQSGHIPKLDCQDRADQWSCPRDCGKVMAEQDPSIGRMVILPVIKPMRGCDSLCIQHRNSGRQKRAVESVSDRHRGQHPQQQRHSVHKTS